MRQGGREVGSDGEAERMTVHHFIYGGTVSDTFTLVAYTNKLTKPMLALSVS